MARASLEGEEWDLYTARSLQPNLERELRWEGGLQLRWSNN